MVLGNGETVHSSGSCTVTVGSQSVIDSLVALCSDCASEPPLTQRRAFHPYYPYIAEYIIGKD